MTRSIFSVPIVSVVFAILLSSCKPASGPSQNPPTSPAPSMSPVASPTAASQGSAATAPSPGEKSAPVNLELKDPVAKVNGEEISKAQLEEAFNSAVQASGVKPEDLTPEQKLNGYRQILDELIMDKLVAKAAAAEVVTDEEVNAEIEKIKKQFPSEEAFADQLKEAGQTPEKLAGAIRKMLQQQRWMKSQIKDQDQVSEADAKAFYESNTKEFESPEMVKASHILFKTSKDDSEEVVKQKEEAAKKAAERAKNGEDFNALAKELSEEPGAKESGGELGFFSKERMVPEFSAAAFSQEPGEIGGPVRTQFGWHVIKVSEKKPAGTTPFEEVKDQIIAYLKSTKQREAVQDVLKKLKDSAQIESTLPSEN